jgi:hypothetical protein
VSACDYAPTILDLLAVSGYCIPDGFATTRAPDPACIPSLQDFSTAKLSHSIAVDGFDISNADNIAAFLLIVDPVEIIDRNSDIASASSSLGLLQQDTRHGSSKASAKDGFLNGGIQKKFEA